MIIKIMLLISLLGFIFIGSHLLWIEDLFGMDSCFGPCVNSYLLFIIICILLLKKNKNN